MTDGKPENEEQHRDRLNKESASVLYPEPLLGSGNKFVKTFEHQMIVWLAKGNGAIDEEIAETLGICSRTLTEHFAKELADGREGYKDFLATGIRVAAKRAIDGDPRYNPVLLRVAACDIGMSDKIQTDHTNSDGSLAPQPMRFNLPVGSLLAISVDGEADCESPAPQPAPTPQKPVLKPKGGKNGDKKGNKSDKTAKSPK